MGVGAGGDSPLFPVVLHRREMMGYHTWLVSRFE